MGMWDEEFPDDEIDHKQTDNPEKEEGNEETEKEEIVATDEKAAEPAKNDDKEPEDEKNADEIIKKVEEPVEKPDDDTKEVAKEEPKEEAKAEDEKKNIGKLDTSKFGEKKSSDQRTADAPGKLRGTDFSQGTQSEKKLVSSDDLIKGHEARLDDEMNQLLKDIRRIGEAGKPEVKFGALFEDPQVEQYYEALVGTLKSAKKRGLIDFKGQILLKGPHDNVVISIKGK